MEPNTNPQPRFVDYLRPITSRWWMVLVAVVIATVGVYAYYAHKPNVYTSSALVYVTDPGDPVNGTQPSATTDRNVDDVASLFDSLSNAAAVSRKIGYSGTATQLLDQVTVGSKSGEDFLIVTASSGSPKQAAVIANAFAGQFVSSLSGAYTSQISDAIRALKADLVQPVNSGPGGQVARASVINELQQLEVDRKVPTTVAQQVNPALAPTSPSAPKPMRNALFALLISLVGVIALCYWLERFDRHLKTADDIESAFALPVLAVLPHSAAPAPFVDSGAALGPDFREAFRSMRTSIELASPDHPPRVIVVTSAMPGEGKSTIVRNLALAFCESGKRVAVVDLDLRNPSLRRLFRVPPGPGFTDLLRGVAKREEAIVAVPTSVETIEDFVSLSQLHSQNGHNGNGNGQLESAVRLAFVRSGPLPANPEAVISSERSAKLLNELRDKFDLVLIDSAPVLAATETIPLLRYADAAVVVGRFGVTSRDTVQRLRDLLARVPDVNVAGVVANDLPRSEVLSYGYGYGHYDHQEPAQGGRGLRPGTGRGQKPKQTA
jgi:polysaccharide biosynthesis transport protein